MKEQDLYPPVHDLFVKLGYKVDAEVKDCDMTALKDDELVIVELKRNLSVALLAQGVKRLRSGADVYLAVPKPKQYSFKKLRSTFAVIKKLELGLIFISLRGEHSFAEIVFKPQPFRHTPRVSGTRREIMREIEGRTVDANTGGVTGTKIITAYTESCIHIACILDMYGDLSPKRIKELGGGDNTYNILRGNFYGWFKNVDKGVYGITEKGSLEILDYPELEKYYTDLLRENYEKSEKKEL